MAAAAGGAAYVLRGASGGGQKERDEERETLILYMMATMVAVVGLIGLLVAFCKGNRRNDPAESFVVDKTVNCLPGMERVFLLNEYNVEIL